ncbi:MAG: glycoside hydrolase family 125 protein [Cutibacterium avidum]|nr:glycoside hydrolase family 125 protein [Cutibacterium avidum]
MTACELTPALQRRLDEVGAQIGSSVSEHIDEASGRQAAGRFVAWMTDTWTRTMTRDDHGVFVVTGDIPAMWLRDSSAQLWPFLALCDLPAVSRQIGDVVARQWHCIGVDPYANAFNSGPTGAHFDPDDVDLLDELWERKYEVDSLAFPVDLAWRLWQATGRPDHLNRAVHEGCQRIVDVWSLEQDHATRSTYRHVRPSEPVDTLGADGSGGPVAPTGMTWSGFRPSDDACRYGYNIPAQFMAIRALRQIGEFCRVWGDESLAERAARLAADIDAGVRQFGVVTDHLAYEVDGLGSVVEMDDANMPSLLSLPLTSDLARDDPLYQTTRNWVLSEANPYLFSGPVARGIGSPHSPEGYIWHIGLAVQGLTGDDVEARDCLRTILATDGGTGWTHESFDPHDPTRYTRGWFSWSNSMACLLMMKVAGIDAITGAN